MRRAEKKYINSDHKNAYSTFRHVRVCVETPPPHVREHSDGALQSLHSLGFPSPPGITYFSGKYKLLPYSRFGRSPNYFVFCVSFVPCEWICFYQLNYHSMWSQQKMFVQRKLLTCLVWVGVINNAIKYENKTTTLKLKLKLFRKRKRRGKRFSGRNKKKFSI